MAGLQRITDQLKFRNKCEKAARMSGVDDPVFYPDNFIATEYYDDGNLHIRQFGLRAVFGLNADAPAKQQNETTRRIMGALNMKRKITDRVLVKEDGDDEDGEECPHCGQRIL